MKIIINSAGHVIGTSNFVDGFRPLPAITLLEWARRDVSAFIEYMCKHGLEDEADRIVDMLARRSMH